MKEPFIGLTPELLQEQMLSWQNVKAPGFFAQSGFLPRKHFSFEFIHEWREAQVVKKGSLVIEYLLPRLSKKFQKSGHFKNEKRTSADFDQSLIVVTSSHF